MLLSELYVQKEGHKSENARKSLNRALEIREAKLGADHNDVLHIKSLVSQSFYYYLLMNEFD